MPAPPWVPLWVPGLGKTIPGWVLGSRVPSVPTLSTLPLYRQLDIGATFSVCFVVAGVATQNGSLPISMFLACCPNRQGVWEGGTVAVSLPVQPWCLPQVCGQALSK